MRARGVGADAHACAIEIQNRTAAGSDGVREKYRSRINSAWNTGECRKPNRLRYLPSGTFPPLKKRLILIYRSHKQRRKALTTHSLRLATFVALFFGLGLATTVQAQKFYANENSDDGVAPRNTMRFEDYHAPTPLIVPSATTILTQDLYKALQVAPKPVLIDVLGGQPHRTISGALWWAGAGLGYRGDSGNRDAHGKFAKKLEEVTGGDKTKPLVFFCLSSQCWLSYNASLRAVAAGYTNVHWYRGGIEAWKEANNDMADTGPTKY